MKLNTYHRYSELDDVINGFEIQDRLVDKGMKIEYFEWMPTGGYNRRIYTGYMLTKLGLSYVTPWDIRSAGDYSFVQSLACILISMNARTTLVFRGVEAPPDDFDFDLTP